MDTSNNIVHGLWIGSELRALEILTLKSFLAHGHEFHLWVYDELKTEVPQGVFLQDANEILPEQHVFQYKNENSFGHGKGSYAGFSDIFRYKLLYEKGGWWADMDVTCLKPLNFPEPYVFRKHDLLAVVGNIMKCPKGSALMKDSFEKAFAQVTADNTDWLKPVVILNEQIVKHKLSKYIMGSVSNYDVWDMVDLYRFFPVSAPSCYYVIHWMNEEYRKKKLDKNTTIKGSFLDKLMKKYQIKTNRIEFVSSSISRDFHCLDE